MPFAPGVSIDCCEDLRLCVCRTGLDVFEDILGTALETSMLDGCRRCVDVRGEEGIVGGSGTSTGFAVPQDCLSIPDSTKIQPVFAEDS